MSYKKIGDYINLVDVRNKDLSINKLLGLTVNKQFIPSVANIIGADMANYKIIKKNQFACSTMQVRRDKKMPVALLKEYDEAIISQAYPIFEIRNESELLPDYLMLWFTRSEFDREACFNAVGGVRGSLEWEDFCEMQVPIPSIEKQKEIVKEYNVVQNRIDINNKLIEKLEETAQAIYKNWFVDFEFPNKKGKPYKSSGGKMVWNEELEKDIPLGWEVKELSEITILKAGGDRPNIYSETRTNNCNIPIYSNGITNEGLYGYTNKANYSKNSITISARGTIGYCKLRNEDFDAIVRLIVVIPNKESYSKYLFEYLRRVEFDNSGSVQNQLTIPQISTIGILLPINDILKEYDYKIEIILSNIRNLQSENQKLEELKEILLSRLAGGLG